MELPGRSVVVELAHVRAAVELPDFDGIAAQRFMEPRPRGMLRENEGIPPKESAVLILIIPVDDGRLELVLTRRNENLRGHSGQISLPGGRCDLQDHSYQETALRETCEELGVCDNIELLGELSPFYIPPSHYNVHPWVGITAQRPAFQPNPAEVAAVFTFGLDDLLHERHKQSETRVFQGVRLHIPYYLVHGHKVWGATAVILSEFEHRLHTVLAD